MLFNSLDFLIFLPVVVVLYYLLPFKFRWVLIFIASCYFYMAFIPKYILILFFVIIIDYVSALLIEISNGKKRLLLLFISLLSNLALLCFFKYFNFINENLQTVFSLFGKEFHPINLSIILPIGLSFHTFQSMSYTIEVYRGKQKAERHLGYFANYVLFFPQMVAGPIERYETLGTELRTEHKPVYENFSNGFRLILFGLFVKMTIADNIAPYVNQIYSEPLKHSPGEVLSAIFLFSFQIYADFFGYSTIALGCARLLGISIMDNFKTPYLSKSLSEFWSRWHISLSTWFKDYLYIPLGGNRVALTLWSINILIVFTISGLWHGASWTFIVWGAVHGLVLLLEKYVSRLFNFKIKEGWNVINSLLVLKTFTVTSFTWIFFRAENFEKARDILNALLGNQEVSIPNTNLLIPFIAAGILISADLLLYKSRFDNRLKLLLSPYRWAIYGLLTYSLLILSGDQKFTFIYFQF
jgi:alginate O-acetyltransferase complex protein AlgI